MIPGSANALLLATAAGAGYTVERSIRLNSADSAFLSRTPASAGNLTTWTWAGWVKRSSTGNQRFFTAGANGTYDSMFQFVGSGTHSQFEVWNYQNGTKAIKRTLALFRDFSAWYHIVVSCTSSTLKIYVNGVEADYESGANNVNPDGSNWSFNGTVSHTLGKTAWGSEYFDGYFAEIYWIDGQALDPTSFGEFDTNGVWQPIAYSGSYGTNGFHLDFADNSSAAALGYDAAGSNDWTVNNIDPSGTVPAPTWYISSTLYTTKSDITTNGTAVNNGGTVAAGNYIYIVPSGNETNGQAIFSANGDLASNHKYWYWNGSSWTQTGGGYNDTDFTSFQWGADDSTAYRLQKNRNFYVLSNYATSPENQSGSLPYFVTNNPGCDSLRDSPTNGDTADDTGLGGEVPGNYATWNPLIITTNNTLSQGNLRAVHAASSWSGNIRGSNSSMFVGTIGVSSGKWYWEITMNDANGTVTGVVSSAMGHQYYVGYSNNLSAGFVTASLYQDSSWGTYQSMPTLANGDIVGVALDMDNGKLWFSKNGTFVNSGNPAAGTGSYTTGITGTLYPALSNIGSTGPADGEANFGSRPFAYTAPSGFKALCTANLPTPTIEDPSTVMDVVTYTGNNSTQVISGLKLSPDLVWLKRRSGAAHHHLYDIVRGTTQRLQSSTTNLESTAVGGVTAFNSDGWTMGNDADINGSSNTFVAWTWDAGSSTVTNTSGSISSQVRANASAGFSIVSWTGIGTAGSYGHGLGVAPVFYITKNRSSAADWRVRTTVIDGSMDFLYLNLTDAKGDSAVSAPTSTVINVGSGNAAENTNGDNYVTYCFAPVAGYSAFGSYTGNGSATDGPFVFTGMRPRWVLIKSSSASGWDWHLRDTARDSYNPVQQRLFPNTSSAESANDPIDVLSNGFKLRTSVGDLNGSGTTYIYAAFAEHPFQTARAR